MAVACSILIFISCLWAEPHLGCCRRSFIGQGQNVLELELSKYSPVISLLVSGLQGKVDAEQYGSICEFWERRLFETKAWLKPVIL
ncbi:hypothetical protein XENTR_v10015065 [Xenopus tropicalis]|nr:hypothetical protein XENTR_v10015065 [Xenopus tropicalis]